MLDIIITELGWYREMKSRPLWDGIFCVFNEPFRQGTNVKLDEMRG
jgi:hypothetical protein